MKLGPKMILAASVLAANLFWLAGAAIAASQPWNAYTGYGYDYGPSYYGYGPGPAYSSYYSPGYAYDYGPYGPALGPYPQSCGYVGGPKTGAWTCFR